MKIRNNPKQFVAMCLMAAVFGVVGTYLLAASHALTPTAAIEAEDGTLSGIASIASVSGASGGQAVKFTSGTSSSLLDTPKIGVYLSGGTDAYSTYPGTKMGSFYINGNSTLSVSQAEARIDNGESIDIEFSPSSNPYITGIVSGDATALSWMNARISSVNTVANYAKAKNNGTYVVATLVHEASGAVGASGDGRVTDTTDPAVIGQAQQIFIQKMKQNAPNAYASIWAMGYDHTFEAAEFAQITNPKPDLITYDPYTNHSCTGSLSTETSGTGSYSITWYKSQPIYNGYIAISETGMATGDKTGAATCTDAQLAAFYTNIKSQIATVEASAGTKIPFYVMFNGTGSFPHNITNGSYPNAKAALKASITNQ